MTEQFGAATRPVESHPVDVRAAFMTRVYLHLMAAVAGFVAIEVALFSTGAAAAIAEFVFGTTWLLILGGFLVVSWLATTVAVRATSPAALYTAFGALVLAEALIFVPLLWIANETAPGTISDAAWLSALGFVGLSGVALTSRTDFSFLGGILKWGFVLALVAIVGGVVFGFDLGMWFSIAMIGLAGGAILYDTQKVLRDYPPDREVAAAMSLFASLALLFWYVLRLLLAARR